MVHNAEHERRTNLWKDGFTGDEPYQLVNLQNARRIAVMNQGNLDRVVATAVLGAHVGPRSNRSGGTFELGRFSPIGLDPPSNNSGLAPLVGSLFL